MQVGDDVVAHHSGEGGAAVASAGHTIGEGIGAKVLPTAADVQLDAVSGVLPAQAAGGGCTHAAFLVVVLHGVAGDGDVTVFVVANEDSGFNVGVNIHPHVAHGVVAHHVVAAGADVFDVDAFAGGTLHGVASDADVVSVLYRDTAANQAAIGITL